MNEAQALALAEKHELSECVELNKQIKFHYRLAAMLTDNRAQVIEELAAKTGVMPPYPNLPKDFHSDTQCYRKNDVDKALAVMQARLEQALEVMVELKDAQKAYNDAQGGPWVKHAVPREIQRRLLNAWQKYHSAIAAMKGQS